MNRWNMTNLTEIRGKDIVAVNGEKIGRVRDIYYVETSGEPEWVTVGTGLLGMQERVVPVEVLQPEGNRLKVPFTKAKVKDEPDFEVKDGALSREDEARLCSHFGTTGRGTHAARVLRYGQEYRGL
jgi:sporulation protein YlmC with PRC-barrel domain